MSIDLERREDGSLALFIDSDLQFDSRDERIYHECLALPALALAQTRRQGDLKALIIGGGDGLTARELLKSSFVSHIDLVDYDRQVVDLACTEFAAINENSMHDPRLTAHVEDAWAYVENAFKEGVEYDLIVSDLTVAQDVEGTRFHSIEWYEKLKSISSPQAILAVNVLSPSATPQAYWSVFNGIILSGLFPLPYHIIQPSFSELGYGLDWGFILASPQAINREELGDGLPLSGPRFALKDAEHLRKLFVFPRAVAEFRSSAKPGFMGSDILLHYMNNGEETRTVLGEYWNALYVNVAGLPVPEAEKDPYLLPPEVRDALSGSFVDPAQEEALFYRLLNLMPALRRFQTRRMVSEFLRNPLTFLEGVDLAGLVQRLLQRAAELPAKLVAELELLRDKLMDWSGDYFSLLQLGTRVMTIVALVVIVGNLFYPDAAYAKGEHGGHGGEHGDHGGRGDHGDRGDHRGDHHDFNHHYDHFGHWGNHWGGYGRWGGWARPWHNWSWGGWGGWGVPFYAGGPGYVNVNLGSNNSNNQAVDSEGGQYPARNYRYQPNYVNNYYWNGEGEQAPAAGGQISQQVQVRPDQSQQDQGQTPPDLAQQDSANFRLGPDTDILPGGKIAIQLTDNAYLLVGASGTQVMDQTTGRSMMTLYNDPSLLWHLSAEIKRQTLGLQSAGQSKQSSNDWQGSLGFPAQQKDNQNEVQNIQGAVDLLNQASQTLGNVPESAPQNNQPPMPGAIEVFTSVWMMPDGSYLILKRADGSLAYLNGKGWYSDMGVTSLKEPYPAKFKAVAIAYLNNLIKESDSTKASLLQDQQEGQDHLQQLNQRLADQQSGDGQAVASVAGSSTNVPAQEANRRLLHAIRRTQRRLDGIQKELNAMPQETAAANKLVTNLQP